MQLRTLVVAALVASPLTLAAQDRQTQRDAFTLSERVPDGQWLRIRNINGGIHITASNTGKVEVTAAKSWRRGDPKDVRVESRKSADGSIMVCAIWPGTTRCDETGYDSHSDNNGSRRDNDVAIDFEVRVPRGVKVGAWSVNGAVGVDGVTNEVRAGTVNGSIMASSTGGPVQASTVNGSVHVSMGRLAGDQDLRFSTVNGSVVAEFTGDIDADVNLSTVNGHLVTDWPVTITGRVDPRHLRATLGKGGRNIRLSTVNGNVELRKK